MSKNFCIAGKSGKILGLHQPVLDGETGQIGIIAQVKLFEEVLAVGVHGLDTDGVGLSDFPVGPA